MTKLTLDVIGLVGFGFDFHAIDTPDEDPDSLVNAFEIVLKGILSYNTTYSKSHSFG
jgi:hypothetical protein